MAHSDSKYPKPGDTRTHSLTPVQPFKCLFKSVAYHIYTAYLFVCNDLDVIVMGVFFGALNASVAPCFSMGPALSFVQILRRTPSMLLWSWGNLFLFNLHNQRVGVGEDKINKPWRPIASGRVTPRQAVCMISCMYPVVLVTGYLVGGFVPCILQSIFSLAYNEFGASTHPLTRSLTNSVGLACLFSGPFEVVTGHSVFSGDGTAAYWLLLLVGAMMTTGHAQDIRDIQGDKATGRKTIPILIGHWHARFLILAGVVGWTGAACRIWRVDWVHGAMAWAGGLALSVNLVLNRTMEGDILSYRIWPFWMIGLFLLPAVRTAERVPM